MSEVATRILSILEKYVSSINARAILSRAIKAKGLDPLKVRHEDVGGIIEGVERSMQIFTSPNLRQRLSADLWELNGGKPQSKAIVVAVAEEADVSRARLMARSMCAEIRASSFLLQKIATAVSELARNIVKYSGTGGSIELSVENAVPRRFIVIATDAGPGIKNLEEIMSGHYVSRTGMGLGLLGTKRLATRFEVATGATGTKIHAEFEL